jgi:hypothetical protein
MKNQKGQALVETALVIPLLLLLIMGLFEFGRAMYIKNTINNAARAGARAAVVTPKYDVTTNPEGLQATPPGTPQSLASCGNFTAVPNSKVFQLICDSIYNGIPTNEVTAEIVTTDLDVSGGLSNGDNVNIKLTWSNFSFITPLGPLTEMIGGSNFNPNSMIGQASMRYE